MTPSEIIDACRAIVARGAKPTRPEVSRLTKAFYALPGNGAGGKLHCVLDDYNYESRFIRWSRDEHSDDELVVALCDVLLMLSNSQRRRGV